MKNITKKIGRSKLALISAGVVASASSAMAVQDWTTITTSVTDEITAVMPAALTVMGAWLAVVIGKKVLARIAS